MAHSQADLGFDPSLLFDQVANDLMARFGADARLIAERALADTAAGDHDALAIWQGVRRALNDNQTRAGLLPPGRIH
ncbi:MAG: hypothetical protein Tsb0016_01570 [Sphingomonadales bacterium]